MVKSLILAAPIKLNFSKVYQYIIHTSSTKSLCAWTCYETTYKPLLNSLSLVIESTYGISPMCVICGAYSKSIPHLSLPFSAPILYGSLFSIFGECWASPRYLDKILMGSFHGFGRNITTTKTKPFPTSDVGYMDQTT